MGGDLAGPLTIPDEPNKRGLSPLIPRPRRAGWSTGCPVSHPSLAPQLPPLRSRPCFFIHPAGAAAPGQGGGGLVAGPGPLGLGCAACGGCPAFPGSASCRRSPAAGPTGWPGSPAELGPTQLRAAPRLPRHRPGDWPRAPLSRRGLRSRWPAARGARAHTPTHGHTRARAHTPRHTHASARTTPAHTRAPVLALRPSPQPPAAQTARPLAAPLPPQRRALSASAGPSPGEGSGPRAGARHWGSVWLPPPLE